MAPRVCLHLPPLDMRDFSLDRDSRTPYAARPGTSICLQAERTQEEVHSQHVCVAACWLRGRAIQSVLPFMLRACVRARARACVRARARACVRARVNVVSGSVFSPSWCCACRVARVGFNVAAYVYLFLNSSVSAVPLPARVVALALFLPSTRFPLLLHPLPLHTSCFPRSSLVLFERFSPHHGHAPFAPWYPRAVRLPPQPVLVLRGLCGVHALARRGHGGHLP
eukprot:6212518-Pleurochrysis_carterae.AAC.21